MKRNGSGAKVSDTMKPEGLWAAALSLLLAALLAGCSMLSERVESRPDTPEEAASSAEALSILEKLQSANARLKNFKGVGRLTIRKDGKIQLDERIAWIGSDPQKLSVVLFASGFAAVRLASDGEWLYYQDHQDPGAPVKRLRSSDPDLKRILSVPIQSSDIITLMCGRIPIREHRSAKLLPVASGTGFALMLSKPGGVQQKIFLDEGKTEVRQTEVYDSSGNLVFQANFVEMQMVDGYKVPLRLVVQNREQKAMVHLLIERYWADVPVQPSMFQLPSPG